MAAVILKAGVEYLGLMRVEAARIYRAGLALPLFGLIGGLLCGLLVDRIAPEAAGSGIPQVKAALNRVRMVLNLRIALVMLLGGMLAFGCGLFMGREGPTVQLGAALAASVSHLRKHTIAYRRQLIAAGTGAGLAVAFNATIAGVVFVFEELLKDVSSSTIIIATVACARAALVINLTAHYSHLPTAELAIVSDIHLVDIPFVALLGVCCAVLGSVFNASAIGAMNCYQQMKKIPAFCGWQPPVC